MASSTSEADASIVAAVQEQLKVEDKQQAAAPAAAAASTDDPGPPHPSGLSLEERFQLCRAVAEECITDDELRNLLKHRPHPVAYDGFEPSGRMHIAQGVMKCINVNRLTRAGCTFKFWVADWFAQLNNKMGGDLKKIQTVGKYMVEVSRRGGGGGREPLLRRVIVRPLRCVGARPTPCLACRRCGRRWAWT